MSANLIVDDSPFHRGEQKVQERLGVRDIEDWARKVVRAYLPDQHRDFHTSLPFLVAAARDEQGQPWATLLTGPEGFITSPDPQSLVINTKPLAGEPLENVFESGVDIGLLGIELADRRRNRVNGRLSGVGEKGLTFSVGQSFGNCPQYIRERGWRRVEGEAIGAPMRGKELSVSQNAWIASADTFFIASGHRGEGDSPSYGMDASHRGGEAGFVQVVSNTRLQFPDYAGNNHYNTIGNLVMDPRAGFLFVDFETGGLLQLTGRATIDWDSEAVAEIPGARRLVIFEIEEVIELPAAVPLRWDANAESVRSIRLVEKVRESEDVTSFVFEARDGSLLPTFKAGQYLPLELEVPGFEGSIGRTYSLSGPPSDQRYRISVKREPKGAVSRYLHDDVEVGEIIDARIPAGDLVLPDDDHPVVLVSAGIGITPMVSMLHALAVEGKDRPAWFVHGARDGTHHALADEVRQLAQRRSGINTHIAYSRPRPEDRLGTDYDSAERVNGMLLASLVDASEAHYFLCGPTGFMAEIQTDLEKKGVLPGSIHTETFGPVTGR